MHQLIIYVHLNTTKEEEVVLLPVSLSDTTTDIIGLTLNHLNIDQKAYYQLYEAKFSLNDNGSNTRLNRQLLRPLHKDECPLVVMYSWLATPDQLLMNLVLQPRETIVVHDKLFERSTLESLYRRLTVVEKEEEKRIKQVRSKYEVMRRLIIRKLNA